MDKTSNCNGDWRALIFSIEIKKQRYFDGEMVKRYSRMTYLVWILMDD